METIAYVRDSPDRAVHVIQGGAKPNLRAAVTRCCRYRPQPKWIQMTEDPDEIEDLEDDLCGHAKKLLAKLEDDQDEDSSTAGA